METEVAYKRLPQISECSLVAAADANLGVKILGIKSDHERIEWSAPTTIYKHCPVFAQEREDARPKRVAPQPEDAMLQADAERERVQRFADEVSERCQELEQENETLRRQVADLTRQLAEAITERDSARAQLARLLQEGSPAALPTPDPEEPEGPEEPDEPNDTVITAPDGTTFDIWRDPGSKHYWVEMSGNDIEGPITNRDGSTREFRSLKTARAHVESLISKRR